jgi:putative membrane protein insertion efficiency factor
VDNVLPPQNIIEKIVKPERASGLKGMKWSPATLIIDIIKLYRKYLSPVLPRSCRFAPSCSEYAIESIQVYGFLSGSLRSLKRISRCHPWGGSGYDPVKKKQADKTA